MVAASLPDLPPLVAAIVSSAGAMTADEREQLKLMLCLAACELVPDGTAPTEPRTLDTFRSIVTSLARLQAHADRVPVSGIAYHGRPAFMTDELLAKLRAESAELRRTADRDEPFCLGLRGGPVVYTLAHSRELTELVAQHAGPVTPNRRASYLYYEHTGHSLPAHVDDGKFAINANVMLRHTSTGDKSSFFYAFGRDGRSTRLVFEPGEIVLLWGDSVVHGRAPLSPGELVNNVTIGFEPKLG